MSGTYQVKVWQEDDWWLARVVGATEDSDRAPLNAVTQARSLARIESMSRDLIATILDADEADFDVELQYVLPSDAGDLVCQAKGARAWLDAAQELWQERSAAAARALTDRGYSLREVATLLGLSHQRVDQILGDHADRRHSEVLVFQCKSSVNTRSRPSPGTVDAPSIDALLVVRRGSAAHSKWAPDCMSEDIDPQVRDRVRVFISEMAWHTSQHSEPLKLEAVNSE